MFPIPNFVSVLNHNIFSSIRFFILLRKLSPTPNFLYYVSYFTKFFVLIFRIGKFSSATFFCDISEQNDYSDTYDFRRGGGDGHFFLFWRSLITNPHCCTYTVQSRIENGSFCNISKMKNAREIISVAKCSTACLV